MPELDCCLQVTEALNSTESTAHEVPYPLLQKLLHAPPTLNAIRQAVASDDRGKASSVCSCIDLQKTSRRSLRGSVYTCRQR